MKPSVATSLRLSPLVFLLLISTKVKGSDSLFVDAGEAMLSPGSVTHLQIDCNRDPYEQAFRDISLFTSLEALWIKGYRGVSFPKAFFAELRTPKLIIEACDKLNLSRLFREMAICELETLWFESCRTGPVQVDLIPHSLAELSFRRCRDLGFSGEMRQPNLRNLILEENGLEEVPAFIADLDSIGTLDLRNNRIRSLPSFMFSFLSFHSLDLRDNPIMNPVPTIGGLAGTTLESLFIDMPRDTSGLAAITLDPDYRMLLVGGRDTLARGRVEERRIQDPGFAILRVTGSQVSVLSDAYLHYEEIMDDARFTYRFDSLLFDERYRDPRYANGLLVNLNSFSGPVDVHPRFPGLSGHFRIALFRKAEERSFYREFPEFTIFRRIQWHYDGSGGVRGLRETMGGDQPVLDIRLLYESGAFAIEVKTPEGFRTIPVYPAVAGGRSNRYYEPDYASLFQRYEKQRSRRVERFNRRLIRQKKQYDRRLERRRETAWLQFQTMYFSPEEKAMTRDEWMEYYEQVRQNESEALRNSPARAGNMRAAFELLGYRQVDPDLYSRTVSDTLRKIVRFQSGDEILNATDVLILDFRNRSFLSFSFDDGVIDHRLGLPTGSILILAELDNGDVAVKRWNSLEAARIPGVVPLDMEVIKTPLHSVGQIIETYDL